MKYLVIIAVTGFATMVVVGCGQGAGNTPSSSTDPTTSPGSSGERATTAEQNTAEQTTSFYRIPVSGHKGVLECADKRTKGAIYDYALGIGKKASPVEQARRRFPKRIEEGDKVEITEQVGPTEGVWRSVEDSARGPRRAGGGPYVLQGGSRRRRGLAPRLL